MAIYNMRRLRRELARSDSLLAGHPAVRLSRIAPGKRLKLQENVPRRQNPLGVQHESIPCYQSLEWA